jgi:uncharacterized protein (DUF433 family)
MRLLLDEHLPIGLSAELQGHAVDTVSGCGWTGMKNGELLRRMSGQYDVLVTMDRSIEFQQRIPTLPFGIALVRAPSTRTQDLKPLVPSILSALDAVNCRPCRAQPRAPFAEKPRSHRAAFSSIVLPRRRSRRPVITEPARITLDPKVLAGKPVVRGTRLSVEFVIGLMAEGWNEADILANYPGITHEDVIACLVYARDTLSSEKVFPSAA